MSIAKEMPRFIICKFCNNSNQGCEYCIGIKVTFENIDWGKVNQFILEGAQEAWNEESPFAKKLI